MRRSIPIRAAALGALSAGVALVSTNAEACSVCVGWPGEQGANVGYYWSAILLTALPFLLVAVFGVWMRHTVRRAREARPGVASRSTGSV